MPEADKMQRVEMRQERGDASFVFCTDDAPSPQCIRRQQEDCFDDGDSWSSE